MNARDSSEAKAVHDAIRLASEQRADLVRERARLAEQIKVGQETIDRSKELLRRMDELLARSPLKP